MGRDITEKTPLLSPSSVGDAEQGEHGDVSVWELRVLLVPYFWPKTWGLRLRVFLSFGFMFVSRGFRILSPLFLKDATDTLTATRLTQLPILAIGLYCVALFGFSLAKQLQTYIYMTVKQHAYQDVAETLFAHLHSLSMNYHLTKKTGKVLRCLDRGSSSTDNIVNVICFRLFPTLVELIVVSIVFIFSFKEHILSVVCVTGVVLYVVITALGTHYRLQFKKQTNEHDNKASEKAVDSLTNFETVKYFCTEEYELRRYMSSISQYQASQLATRGLLNAIVVAQQLIQQTVLAICLFISARNVFRGVMSVGDFVAVTVYIGNIFKPLDSLGNIYNTIVQSFVDMENLVELLRIEPEVRDRPGAVPLRVDPAHSSVEFKNVNFRYPGQPADNSLKSVSFDVSAGQTLAIVGPTGSGKTTISRLLFRFYDVTSGKIFINSQDITSVTQKTLRQSIGIVPQDTVMFNDSIRYNLLYGRPYCSDDEMIAAVKAANIYDLIMSLPRQFDTEIGERGLKLSGGEKQRIAIARLILKNPSIVLLDEATSSLDTVTESSIHDALNVACEGRTTLIIAHRLSTVRHADAIVVLQRGIIVERGDHASLLQQRGVYHELWSQQAKEADPGTDDPEDCDQVLGAKEHDGDDDLSCEMDPLTRQRRRASYAALALVVILIASACQAPKATRMIHLAMSRRARSAEIDRLLLATSSDALRARRMEPAGDDVFTTETEDAEDTAADDAEQTETAETKRRAVEMRIASGEGSHTVTVEVGGQPRELIIDTGSGKTAFVCEGCDRCGIGHVHAPFQFTNETTYVECTPLMVGDDRPGSCTKCDDDGRCRYGQKYVEGDYWEGVKVTDRLAFVPSGGRADELSANVAFGCIYEQTGCFNEESSDGIMGFSRHPDSIFEQFYRAGATESRVFAQCLAKEGGVLTLGGVDTALHTEPVQYTPLRDTGYQYWTVQLESVTIGDSEVEVQSSVFNADRGCVLDSGTTFVYLPTRAREAFVNAWHKAVGNRDETYIPVSDTYYNMDAAVVDSLPPLCFHFANDAKLCMGPRQYLFQLTQHEFTGTIFFGDNTHATIVGASALMHHNIIYDVDNKRVGIAPAACDGSAERSAQTQRVLETQLGGDTFRSAIDATYWSQIVLFGVAAAAVVALVNASWLEVEERKEEAAMPPLERRMAAEEAQMITAVNAREVLLRNGDLVESDAAFLLMTEDDEIVAV
ncbi:hypothetical protein P43SY_006680 [Pythium insidiosum]|uniref:Uncharacterized protein n=1 Tax=Pythium insidiosum TaxID=114742 RepID=A0AAD5Q678_PYTIN|nr:hypothetical protein P43SY_006680 [Pythium insidiosum]